MNHEKSHPSDLVGQIITIPAFPEAVRVLSVRPVGGYLKLEGEGRPSGRLHKAMLKPSDLESVFSNRGQGDAFSAPLEQVQLGLEAHRIRLGYSFDPHFAVSSSVVDPLPHQLEAVYRYLLPQPRVRFMLADDPGAGKTVMAGLLLKELLFRGALERVLIVTPANLTDQWRREMSEKFHETFSVMNSATVNAAYGQNPWEAEGRVITSIDFAKREEHRRDLEAVSWDLIIVDEAHKMTATVRPGGTESSDAADKVAKSERYRLGEVLSLTATHFVLLTATPHRGDPEGFRLLLDLVEPGLFATTGLLEQAVRGEENPLFLRRLKEDMVGFDGKPLFPPRHPHTVGYRLSRTERDLYEAVTSYVTEHFARAFTLRRRNIGFAMTVLQRRLTSSVYAIYKSLKGRHDRLTRLRAQAIDATVLAGDDGELPDNWEDLSEEETWRLEQELLERLTLARNLPQLDAEISALKKLVEMAEFQVRLKQERKLEELRRVMTELLGTARDGDLNERLLIFTEHKDTLDFLKGEIKAWGYRVTSIDGSMKLEERIAAEREFRDEAQVMIATEAAGEGINLQFCHLMVNYDLPWNPNRLEQRMGRIHRYGQKLEVHIYNLVAENTREGEVLGKLLSKLEEMRAAMGSERVYDVLGEILADVDLENLMRENLAQRVSLEAIKASLDARLDERVVRRLLEKTEVALARQFVNLAALEKDVEASRLQRLHPEYTERFFRAAFAHLGGRLEGRATPGLFAVTSVPPSLRDSQHPAVRRFGGIPRAYPRVAFDKGRARELDAELISPGHPLFEVTLEQTLAASRDALHAGTTLHLPDLGGEALLGFYLLAVQDATGGRAHERLVCLEHTADGVRLVPNHILLDAVPAEVGLESGLGAGEDEMEVFLADTVLPAFLGETVSTRGKNLAIREKYAQSSYRHLLRESQTKLAKYRVEARTKDMTLAIAQEERRQELLTRRFSGLRTRLEQERNLSPRPPELLTLARALPAPPTPEEAGDEPAHSREVEMTAMRVALEYERAEGRVPVDVSLDGVGYDLHSQSPEGTPMGQRERRHIEVKGRAGVGGVKLYVSEVVTAGRLGAEYYLYIVSNCASAKPTLEIVRDPVNALGAEVKAVQFDVPLSAWKAVATPAGSEG